MKLLFFPFFFHSLLGERKKNTGIERSISLGIMENCALSLQKILHNNFQSFLSCKEGGGGEFEGFAGCGDY